MSEKPTRPRHLRGPIAAPATSARCRAKHGPAHRQNRHKSHHQAAQAQKNGAAPPALRRMRVLAADDNRTNRLVFGKMVQEADIDLHYAEDGATAIAAFQQHQPDLIFMDISMPGIDGKEATAQIRALPGGTIPIIAMTAHAMQGDREQILAAGLDDYLTKPIRKADVLAHIAQNQPANTRPPLPSATPP